jgi:predicted TIM-barrel enzyme
MLCAGKFNFFPAASWPGLQSLSFEGAFNQIMEKVSLPLGLQCLIFGCQFNQDMDKVSCRLTCRASLLKLYPRGLRCVHQKHALHVSTENVEERLQDRIEKVTRQKVVGVSVNWDSAVHEENVMELLEN